MTERRHGAQFSPAADRITFRGFTNPAVIEKDYQQGGARLPYVLSTVASSTLEDRMGDQMLPSMLDDFKQFPTGSAYFRDHSYRVVEDIIAHTVSPPAVEMTVANQDGVNVKAGQSYMTLRIDYQMLDNNPAGMQVYGYIERGTRIGTSVGVEVTDYDVRKDSSGDPIGLLLAHGELVEVSSVGIPANRESYVSPLNSDSMNWTARAVKGLRKQLGITLDFENEDTVAYQIKHWGDFDEIDQVFLRRMDGILRNRGLCIAQLRGVVE